MEHQATRHKSVAPDDDARRDKSKPGAKPTTRCKVGQNQIAVVSMASRFPGGADDTEKFWELLAQGRDV